MPHRIQTSFVCGMAGTWLWGAYHECARVHRVQQVTMAPRIVQLSQDPLIQKWMKCPSPTGFRMPTNLFKPKGSGVTDGSDQVDEVPELAKTELPLTVLDMHPPAACTSFLSNAWLALYIVPIPFMIAFRLGCMSVPEPKGCTHERLLQYVQCDPVLMQYMEHEHEDIRERFRRHFDLKSLGYRRPRQGLYG
jgi:hypothetical protein